MMAIEHFYFIGINVLFMWSIIFPQWSILFLSTFICFEVLEIYQHGCSFDGQNCWGIGAHNSKRGIKFQSFSLLLFLISLILSVLLLTQALQLVQVITSHVYCNLEGGVVPKKQTIRLFLANHVVNSFLVKWHDPNMLVGVYDWLFHIWILQCTQDEWGHVWGRESLFCFNMVCHNLV